MNYNATVVKLENVRKHPNADRLQLADAANEQVIIGLDHTEGEVGVFVPAGTVLNHEFLMANRLYRKHPETGEEMGGYIETNGRVRFQRLRKEMSRGLWLPLHCLDYLCLDNVPVLGTSFQELEGHEIVQKYIEPSLVIRQGAPGKAISELFELFYRIGDTSRLTDNLHRLKPGDDLVFTVKMHGTSGRTGFVPKRLKTIAAPTTFWEKFKAGWKNLLLYWATDNLDYETMLPRVYEHVSGTRRTVLAENPYHAEDDYRKYAHDLLKPHLQRGQTVFYEIVGPGIMPAHSPEGIEDKATRKELTALYGNQIIYSYGQQPGTFGVYIYKIIEHNVDDGAIVYGWDQLVDWCNLHGLNHVPVLDRMIYDGDKVKLMEYVKTLSNTVAPMFPDHPNEGVVIQTRYGPFKHKGNDFCILEDIRPYAEPEPELVDEVL